MPDAEPVKKIISGLPDEPGVYLMKDGAGSIVYIGKAASIRKRVSSYFRERGLDIKTRVLVTAIRDIEYIITDSDNLSFIDRIGSDINKGLLSKVAALAALDDQSSMREYVDAVEESRKMLWQSLPESGYEFHLASANYFLLKVSDSGRAAKLLLADGILIKRLGAKERLDGYLRITLGTPAQTDRLLLSLSKHASRLATGFNRNRIPETVDRVAVRVKEVASKGK